MRFWVDMKKIIPALKDKLMIGNNSDGSTCYANVEDLPFATPEQLEGKIDKSPEDDILYGLKNGGLSEIKSPEGAFVKRLVGTQDNPVIISTLTNGIYEISGYIRISPTDVEFRTDFIVLPFIGTVRRVSDSQIELTGFGNQPDKINYYRYLTSKNSMVRYSKDVSSLVVTNSSADFIALPTSSIPPTKNTHFVNKEYVDTSLSNSVVNGVNENDINIQAPNFSYNGRGIATIIPRADDEEEIDTGLVDSISGNKIYQQTIFFMTGTGRPIFSHKITSAHGNYVTPISIGRHEEDVIIIDVSPLGIQYTIPLSAYIHMEDQIFMSANVIFDVTEQEIKAIVKFVDSGVVIDPPSSYNYMIGGYVTVRYMAE